MIFELLPLIILFVSGILGACFNLFKVSKYGLYISAVYFIALMFFNIPNIELNWFMLNKLQCKFSFCFSPTSLILCSLILWILVSLYLAKGISFDKSIERKFGLLNIFVFFMCLAILADNIFQFYIGLEALGIISTILVGLEKQADEQSSKVYLFNKFASILFLCAIAIISIKSGGFEIEKIKQAYMKQPHELLWPSCLLLVACFCKGAQFPFSQWLLDATKANIFASILIHAGTIVAVGIIFITKFYFIFETFPILKNIMMAVGLYTSFWMSCCSLINDNIKKIIACLTASSAGIMFISCGMGGYSLALLYFICHAFFKSMLFLSFAYLISAMSGEQDLSKFGGLLKLAPKISDMILISFLFAAGFPFLSGFIAKLSFVETINLSEINFIAISNIMINIITIMSMSRMLLKSLYGTPKIEDLYLSRASNSDNYNSVPFWLLAFMALLGSFTIWSMYECGDLSFGYGGIIYVTNNDDYATESVFSVIQIVFAIGIIALMQKYPNTNYKISKIFYLLLRKNYHLGEFVIYRILRCVSYVFNTTSVKISNIFNVNLFSVLLDSGKRIIKIHTNLFCNQVYWIIVGIITSLAIIAIKRF